MRKFTEDHEWLKIEGNVATVGITQHAAGQLGDLVFVDPPEIGAVLERGEPLRPWNPSTKRPIWRWSARAFCGQMETFGAA